MQKLYATITSEEVISRLSDEHSKEDLTQYSTVFVGAPVWWSDWPMIMYTFFEKNADALAGKTLIPFSTHAGSGLSGFDKKLSSACPGSTVGEGLAVAGFINVSEPYDKGQHVAGE